MIWSVVFIKGPARLYVVNGMMNAEQYKTVLESRLLPRFNDWFPDGNCVFMQDGLHTANLIKNFFNSTGLEVLPWPGNSPDMNPIEAIWFNLKDKVNDVVSTNKRKLIERIVNVWHQNPDIAALISKYNESMPNRIKALIKAKDGAAKNCCMH